MTCDELYPRLTDLGEGALSGDVCDEIERHLAGCDGCRLLRQDLEDRARLCRAEKGATTMPASVRQRISALLGAGEGGPARPPAR